MIVFSVMIIVLTMHFSVGNKVLEWCGRNLFELYILQRIPMIVLKAVGIANLNIYLYFVCCVILTVLLVKPFKYVTDKMWLKIVNSIENM